MEAYACSVCLLLQCFKDAAKQEEKIKLNMSNSEDKQRQKSSFLNFSKCACRVFLLSFLLWFLLRLHPGSIKFHLTFSKLKVILWHKHDMAASQKTVKWKHVILEALKESMRHFEYVSLVPPRIHAFLTRRSSDSRPARANSAFIQPRAVNNAWAAQANSWSILHLHMRFNILHQKPDVLVVKHLIMFLLSLQSIIVERDTREALGSAGNVTESHFERCAQWGGVCPPLLAATLFSQKMRDAERDHSTAENKDVQKH